MGPWEGWGHRGSSKGGVVGAVLTLTVILVNCEGMGGGNDAARVGGEVTGQGIRVLGLIRARQPGTGGTLRLPLESLLRVHRGDGIRGRCAMQLRGGGGKAPIEPKGMLPRTEDADYSDADGGQEGEEREVEEEESRVERISPKVLARRRRNQERRRRLSDAKLAERERERVRSIKEQVAIGARVMTHFKAKGGGRSSACREATVTRVREGGDVVKVMLPSRLKQKVPVGWVVSVGAVGGKEERQVVKASGGEEVVERKNKPDDAKLREIARRRRVKKRQRRLERWRRKKAEAASEREEEEARQRREEEGMRKKAEAEAEERKEAEREEKKQRMFNSTDPYLADSFTQYRDIVDRMDKTGILKDPEQVEEEEAEWERNARKRVSFQYGKRLQRPTVS